MYQVNKVNEIKIISAILLFYHPTTVLLQDEEFDSYGGFLMLNRQRTAHLFVVYWFEEFDIAYALVVVSPKYDVLYYS